MCLVGLEIGGIDIKIPDYNSLFIINKSAFSAAVQL